MGILTYNNVFDLLAAISGAHKQLKFHSDGEIANFNGTNYKDTHAYPGTWAMPTFVTQRENQTAYSIRLYAFDLVKKTKANERETLSDTLQYLQDFVRVLRNHSQSYNLEFDNTYYPFNEEFNAECSGWYGDLIIVVDFDASECGIPIVDFSEPGTNPNEGHTDNPLTCENLADCETFIELEERVTALEEAGSNAEQLKATFIAGENLGGQRLVIVSGGKVFYFDPTNEDHYNRQIGLTNSAAVTDENVEVILDGIIDGFSGAITQDEIYFADVNGQLTNTTPTSGIDFPIGIAIDGNSMRLFLNEQVIL